MYSVQKIKNYENTRIRERIKKHKNERNMDDDMVHWLYRSNNYLRIFHMEIWRKQYYTIFSINNGDCLWVENAPYMEYKPKTSRKIPQKTLNVHFVNVPLISECFFIRQNQCLYPLSKRTYI